MNTKIFTHDDTDGICSGALVLATDPDAQTCFTNPYRLLDDLQNIRKPEKVIICDISIPEDYKNQIIKKFSKIVQKAELIYIDHHPLPERISEKDIPGIIIHNKNLSASELTYHYLQQKLNHEHTKLAIYGAIADYLDHTPLIQGLLKKWDQITIYLETGILYQGITSLKKGDHDSKRDIILKLANNIQPSQNEDLVTQAIQYTRKEWEVMQKLKDHIKIDGKIAYTINFPFSLGKTATYVRGMTDAVISIAAEKRRYKTDMSLRTCNKNINLNMLLRQITPKLKSSGGGHPTAAGARYPQYFLQTIFKGIKRNPKTTRTSPIRLTSSYVL